MGYLLQDALHDQNWRNLFGFLALLVLAAAPSVAVLRQWRNDRAATPRTSVVLAMAGLLGLGVSMLPASVYGYRAQDDNPSTLPRLIYPGSVFSFKIPSAARSVSGAWATTDVKARLQLPAGDWINLQAEGRGLVWSGDVHGGGDAHSFPIESFEIVVTLPEDRGLVGQKVLLEAEGGLVVPELTLANVYKNSYQPFAHRASLQIATEASWRAQALVRIGLWLALAGALLGYLARTIAKTVPRR